MVRRGGNMPKDLTADIQNAITSGELDATEVGEELGASPDLSTASLDGSRISPSEKRRPEIASTLRERFGLPAKAAFADRIERPNSLKDLVSLVEDALKSKERLRIVGAARSHSSASHPVGTRVVSTEKLDAIFSGIGTDIKGLSLRAGIKESGLVRVQCGVPVREALSALSDSGRAIPNHGSGDFQSVVGAISTGTHGSGVDFWSVAGFVRALVVVRVKQTANGPVPYVELIQRKPGAAQQAPVYEAPPGGTWRSRTGNVEIHAVFDDDRFFAHIVGMGSLGLVYSMTLRVIPMLNLQEWRKPALLDTVLKDLDKLNKDHRHVELVVDPYPREPVQNEPISKWKAVRSGNAFDFGAVRCQAVLRKETKAKKGGARPLTMEAGRLPAAAGIIGGQIRSVLKDPVGKGPKAGHSLIACTSIPNGTYIDALPEVLLLNLKYRGLGAEWAVPMSKLRDALRVILEKGCWEPWRKRRDAWAAGPPSDDALVKSLEEDAPFFQGPSVRFVRADGALLAGSHERNGATGVEPVWAHIEVGFLGAPHLEEKWRPRKRHLGIRPEEVVVDQVVDGLLDELKKKDALLPNAKDLVEPESCGKIGDAKKRRMMRLYAAYERGRIATFEKLEAEILALGGRPHQGLWHTLDWTQVKAAWGPSADKWRACFLEANPAGTFDGPLTDQWKIRTTP